MANLTPVRTPSSVYQLESTDAAQGGFGGIMNAQAQSLFNNTQYLLGFQRGGGSFLDMSAQGLTAGPQLSDSDTGRIFYIGNTSSSSNGYKYVVLPQTDSSGTDIGQKGDTFTFINDSPTVFIKVFPFAVTTNDRFYMYDAYQTILTVRPYEIVTVRRVVGAAAWVIIERMDLVPAMEAGQLTLQVVQPRRSVACNGAQLSKLLFDRLFAVLGTTYGSTSTTFGVPNLPGVNLPGTSTPANYFIYY